MSLDWAALATLRSRGGLLLSINESVDLFAFSRVNKALAVLIGTQIFMIIKIFADKSSFIIIIIKICVPYKNAVGGLLNNIACARYKYYSILKTNAAKIPPITGPTTGIQL